MLGRIARQRENNDSDGAIREPLLNSSQDDLPNSSGGSRSGNVLFTVDDDDDYPESSALDGEPSAHKPEHHTVRFQEEVQVIGLPLRSTTQSRETGE